MQAAVTERTYRKAKIDRAPPVAATTAVMRAESSRQMNQASRRGSDAGPSKSIALDDASAMTRPMARIWLSPGIRPEGANGASTSRTSETPSRAQANPRSGPSTVNAFTPSLHQGDQTEDRQVHCDHESSDDHAQEDDHDRLEQRGERGDRGVDFVVVEVGDLGEHLVERARVLADVDHVDDHRRKHGAPPERLREGAAGGDRGPGLHHGSLDDPIAGRARGDEQPLEDRDAGRDERPERPREARDGNFADEHADDRYLQEESIDHVAAVLSVVVALERVDHAGAHAHHEQDVLLREFRQPHHDHRRQRQVGAEPLEHLRERRDDEDHHEHDDQHRHADDRDRIHHSALHLALELGRLLDVARQALQDDVEHTAGLADLEHVGEEIVEDLGILAERLGQGRAAFDLARDLAGDVAQSLRIALLRENRQALGDRETGVHHGGELPGVDREILVPDLAADLLDAGRLDQTLLDRGRDDAPGAQRHDGRGSVVRFDLAGDDGSARSSAKGVHGHGLRSSYRLANGETPAPALAMAAGPSCASSCSSSSVRVDRFSASSLVIRWRFVRSASDWFIVCMPNFWPVAIAEYTWWIFSSRMRLRMAGVAVMISSAITRPPPTFGMSVCESTPSSTSASCARTCACWAVGNTSMIRFIVWAHELVCRVPNVRWPVSAIVSAAAIVSRSRISPTRTTSGSCRRIDLSAFVKDCVSAKTSRWLTRHDLCGWTNSIGSSIVMMWSWRSLLILSIMAASVVDLPEPVGPVTRISPFGRSASCCTICGSPSSSNERILYGMTRIAQPTAPRCR